MRDPLSVLSLKRYMTSKPRVAERKCDGRLSIATALLRNENHEMASLCALCAFGALPHLTSQLASPRLTSQLALNLALELGAPDELMAPADAVAQSLAATAVDVRAVVWSAASLAQACSRDGGAVPDALHG